MGRHSTFTQALADEICERLSKDESLASICRDKHMPDVTTVWHWQDRNETFRLAYARAREQQGHAAADVVGDIRRQILTGEIDKDVGTAAANLAKWEAGRRASKFYGDKVQTELSGPNGEAIKIEQKVQDDADVVARAIASLADRGGAASLAEQPNSAATGKPSV